MEAPRLGGSRENILGMFCLGLGFDWLTCCVGTLGLLGSILSTGFQALWYSWGKTAWQALVDWGSLC